MVGTATEKHELNGANLADLANLRWVSDQEPGIKRIRRGKGFTYAHEGGGARVKERDRQRIKDLAIPPAWAEVWICPDAEGHIQATGRDAEGRKQYRYHSKWEQVRDEVKFERMLEFARCLPRLRKSIISDLAGPGLPRSRVVALCTGVLDQTLIRIGNERYAQQNGSFGLTTLAPRHADVEQGVVRFAFDGKGGQPQEVAVADRRLARLVAQCQELAGQRLFSYLNEAGELSAVTSDDVNSYLREATGMNFTAKDFRTWGASALVVNHLATMAPEPPDRARAFREAVDVAALALGNTRAVCRQAYVHPAIEQAHQSGDLQGVWAQSRRSKWLARPERALQKLLAADG
ncbi:MAG TPA: DNA topoisomerase IB [Acidimicrobiia bacterium]|nr:DNA topoisomerase IB [Acidimicrobiia bacterium]